MSEFETKIGLPTLWAIGVGSVLGGDFFGWQFVLYGGFGSALLAIIFASIFYWLYAGAITELASRFKTSGGSFDFVNETLGQRSAALMAVLGLLKLILANSALALAISSYLIQGGVSSKFQFLIWLLTYFIFTILDSIGVRQSANVQLAATVLCLLLLLLYVLSCFTQFNISHIKAEPLFYEGWAGFMKGLPFALQFFDGFEEVPLLISYTIDPPKTIPKAMLFSYTTVASIGLLVLVSASGVNTASQLINSEAPLMLGMDLVYGNGVFSDTIAYSIVLGLLVNFFAFVLFTSQQVQAVAAAGQLPFFLSIRHPIHGAPINASICSSIFGLLLTSIFAAIFGEAEAQNTLVTAALLPAVLGYALLLNCIPRIRKLEDKIKNNIKLSKRDLKRLGNTKEILWFEYGIIGARIAQLMCLIFCIALIYLASTEIVFMYGVIMLLIIGTILFGVMNYFININMNQWKDNMRLNELAVSDDNADYNDKGNKENDIYNNLSDLFYYIFGCKRKVNSANYNVINNDDINYVDNIFEKSIPPHKDIMSTSYNVDL
jgi:ethanolamine permease